MVDEGYAIERIINVLLACIAVPLATAQFARDRISPGKVPLFKACTHWFCFIGGIILAVQSSDPAEVYGSIPLWLNEILEELYLSMLGALLCLWIYLTTQTLYKQMNKPFPKRAVQIPLVLLMLTYFACGEVKAIGYGLTGLRWWLWIEDLAWAFVANVIPLVGFGLWYSLRKSVSSLLNQRLVSGTNIVDTTFLRSSLRRMFILMAFMCFCSTVSTIGDIMSFADWDFDTSVKATKRDPESYDPSESIDHFLCWICEFVLLIMFWSPLDCRSRSDAAASSHDAPVSTNKQGLQAGSPPVHSTRLGAARTPSMSYRIEIGPRKPPTAPQDSLNANTNSPGPAHRQSIALSSLRDSKRNETVP